MNTEKLEYQGWTNHSTWAAHLEVLSDETIYNQLMNCINDFMEFKSIAKSFYGNDSDVNWLEIYESFKE